jgi:putative transposase
MRSSVRLRELIESTNVETIRLLARSPSLHSFAERWVRNLQGKGNLILFPLQTEGARNRKAVVRCRERLGGLLKYYEREAA